MKLFIVITLALCMPSCRNIKEQTETSVHAVETIKNESAPTVHEVNQDSVLLETTKQVLTAIKNKDYTTLASYIHPVSGIRFSPYAYIDTVRDITLKSEKFPEEVSKHDVLIWGNYDGSGDTIRLSIDNYFKKFVYDHDFLNAEKTSLNKITGKGNSTNNLEEVYSGCVFTESYFSGFDKKFEGMDWESLRLVYKKYGARYFLVGIVHDQWTI
ncbi:MAG: hypothetical protein ABJB16_16235 [Saprospiraceae bacterium]